MEDHTNDTPQPEEEEVSHPYETEPQGPLEGLLQATAARYGGSLGEDPNEVAEAEILEIADGVGAQEEGIQSSQLLGMMLATVLAIACMVFVLYFVFFVTQRDKAREVAGNVPSDRYVEQRELRAEADNALSHFALSPAAEGRYQIPVETAMEIVERNATSGMAPLGSRTAFNLAWLTLHPPPATQSTGTRNRSGDTGLAMTDSTAVAFPVNLPVPGPEDVQAPADAEGTTEEGH